MKTSDAIALMLLVLLFVFRRQPRAVDVQVGEIRDVLWTGEPNVAPSLNGASTRKPPLGAPIS